MSRPVDIGGKRLISLMPGDWASWITELADLVVRRIVSSEFQFVSHANDILILVHSETEGDFLLLIELQLHHDRQMPRRIQTYAALGEERYRLPVYPVVIQILPPAGSAPIADRYDRTFLGLRALREYRVVRLWEVDAAWVVQTPIRSLIPFVPVMRGGDDESVIRRALTTLQADEQLREIEPLFAFFATFALDVERVLEIMRWDMVVLRQSPWYNEILEEGRQEGLQAARDLVIQELLAVLEQRFAPLSPDMEPALQRLPLEALPSLIAAATTDASLAAFRARLP